MMKNTGFLSFTSFTSILKQNKNAFSLKNKDCNLHISNAQKSGGLTTNNNSCKVPELNSQNINFVNLNGVHKFVNV